MAHVAHRALNVCLRGGGDTRDGTFAWAAEDPGVAEPGEEFDENGC